MEAAMAGAAFVASRPTTEFRAYATSAREPFVSWRCLTDAPRLAAYDCPSRCESVEGAGDARHASDGPGDPHRLCAGAGLRISERSVGRRGRGGTDPGGH